MRKLLLNTTPLFRKLRQLSLLLSLLLALPQNVWGDTTYGSNAAYSQTNNTWGDWILSDGPTYESTPEYYLSFSGASTITLTLTCPANTTDLIRNITLEIGGNLQYTDLLSAKIGNTDITTDFQENGGTYSYTPTIPAGWSGNIVVTLKSVGSNSTSGSILSAYVYTVTNYGVTVAGIPVTSTNAANGITGSGITGTVTYDATNRILTMTNATINYTSGDAITFSNTNTLNVNLVNTNSISCGDHKAFNTGGNLNFQGTGTYPGQLTITSTSNINPQSYYTCTGSVTYQNGLIATNLTSSSVLISTNYGINVGGTEVTSANATNVLGENTPSVSYDADNNILTLNQAIISGAISTELNNLTINLKGANSINTTTTPGKNGIISNKNTGTLTFTKEGANASLTITSDVSVIRGFASLSLDNSGLYTNTSTPYKIKSDSSYPRLADATTSDADTTAIKSITISDVATYQLWVSGVQVTEGANITGAGITGTVTFNASNNTLSLNGASISGILLNNLDELKIEFTGANSITNNYYITSLNTNAALTMSGTGVNSTFAINTGTSSTCAVSGFASLNYSNGTYLQSTNACRYKTDVKEIRSLSDNKISTLSFTTTPYYPLWIYSQQFSSAAIPLQSGTASYDATNQTLTLNNASLSNSNVIESELEGNLTISLIGDNSLIVNTGSNSPIMSGVSTAKLTIKNAGTDDSQLSLGFYGTSNPPVIKGFESISHTGLNFASKTGSSITDAATNDAVLSSATIYPLWVLGTMVTGINKGHILGASDTSVTFDGTNTLTLNGANFSGMIESGLGNLTIHLTGTNIIQQSNNETNLITSSNSGVLTFETDATPGSLSFLDFGSSASAFSGTPFSGFSNIVYGTGIDYDDTNKKICNISYPLTVAGTTVTSLNKNGVLGDNKVTFDPSSNTITLNGATINGSSGIVYNGTTDFTIAINGSNSIVNTTGNYAIVKTTTTNSLKFEKATNASTAELALKWATGDKAISANDSILGNGLYWKPIAATQMNITDNPEFVIVGDYAIPDGTPVNGATSGTITYNATDKLLTISSFSQTFAQDAIKTSVSGLKVKLVGASTISCNNGGSAFTASTTSASIQFVKNDANSKLTMVTSQDPLFNFANGAITYDELYYYYDVDNHQYIIKPKNSPTIKFVERNQADGSIPTTQSAYQYVAENSTIQLTYGTDFYAPKPVFSDGYVLTDSTRYVYSMSVDGVVEFELGGNTYSNPGKIAYADNGKLNILQSGELTITCSFPGNLQNEPCSASYTLKITRVFNNPFANTPAEQIYATYYNEYEDLSLPDGIEAYIVTGVSGNSVTTTATGYLPQNTAVLLEKTGNVGTTITGYTGSAGNFNGNLLKYTSANAVVNTTGKEYILYKNEFVKATGNISGSCYLDLSGTNLPARGVLGIGNDGSTAIEGIDVEATEDETWYDLQGRRIQKPTKAGIYIVNGKKVIINNK